MSSGFFCHFQRLIPNVSRIQLDDVLRAFWLLSLRPLGVICLGHVMS